MRRSLSLSICMLSCDQLFAWAWHWGCCPLSQSPSPCLHVWLFWHTLISGYTTDEREYCPRLDMTEGWPFPCWLHQLALAACSKELRKAMRLLWVWWKIAPNWLLMKTAICPGRGNFGVCTVCLMSSFLVKLWSRQFVFRNMTSPTCTPFLHSLHQCWYTSFVTEKNRGWIYSFLLGFGDLPIICFCGVTWRKRQGALDQP